MAEGGGAGGVPADGNRRGGGRLGGGRLLILRLLQVLLIADHVAGAGAYVIGILPGLGGKFDLIDHDPVLAVQLYLQRLHLRGGDAGVAEGGGAGGVLADAALVADGAGLGHCLGLKVAGLGNEGDIANGQGSQIALVQRCVLGGHLLDQGGLA